MPSQNNPILAAQNVCKNLGAQDLQILKDVSLDIQPQDFLSIIGPSGSGKTTLLYLLGALDQPTSGQILIGGVSTSGMKEKALTQLRQKKLGFVFQFHFLLPEFTALDNVAIPAILAGASKDKARQKATHLLERVGLSHRLGHRPGELSGGEQQRIALARALVNDPLLLLADEPTGNLDSANTQNVFELLKELNQEGLAIVLVTHDLKLASKTEQQIHMLDGQIKEITYTGAPHDLA